MLSLSSFIKQSCFGFFLLSALLVSYAQSNTVLPSIWLLLDDVSGTRFDKVIDAYSDLNSAHVFIAAHRGGKENDREDGSPGNSIVNIANASRNHFDIFESDIEILLRGGQETLVVFHDDVFDFLTNTTQVDDKLDDADITYAKSRVMVKFDLKSGVFTESRLIAIFNIIQKTDTQDQVLIRGGNFLLTTAQDNGYDTRTIMRRYNSEPSIADINSLTDNFEVKAISIPNGASAALVQAANDKGLIVEVHESQGVSDQQRETDWQAALDVGVRQFHSFKPTLLRTYLEQNGYREF